MRSARQWAHRGFNLVEAAVVLGVIGVVVGGIWIAAAEWRERFLIQRTIEQLGFMVECARGKLQPWHVVAEATSGLRNLQCLPPDVTRRNTAAGWMLSLAYWRNVSVDIDGDGEMRVSFFASAAQGQFRPGQCDRLTQAIANAFGTSGEYLLRIYTVRSSGGSTYYPDQFPYAVEPDKCGDYPRFFFSIPKQ